MAKFDNILGTRLNHFIRQHCCMRAMKPIWGIHELMAKHLHDSEYQPDSVNTPNLSSTGTGTPS